MPNEVVRHYLSRKVDNDDLFLLKKVSELVFGKQEWFDKKGVSDFYEGRSDCCDSINFLLFGFREERYLYFFHSAWVSTGDLNSSSFSVEGVAEFPNVIILYYVELKWIFAVEGFLCWNELCFSALK